MARKKTTITQDQLDKYQRLQELRKRLQAFSDKHKYEYMSELTKSWNAKNDEKIKESVKMENRFHFHFIDGASVLIESNTMRLG